MLKRRISHENPEAVLQSRRQDGNKAAQDERLREEIEEHLDFQTAENIRAGMAPAEARRQALLKLGAVEAIKEDCQAQSGLQFIETVLQDLRYALRLLWKAPASAPLLLPLWLWASARIPQSSV